MLDTILQDDNDVDASTFLQKEMYAEVDREVFHRNRMDSELITKELEELDDYKSLQTILASNKNEGSGRVKKYYKFYRQINNKHSSCHIDFSLSLQYAIPCNLTFVSIKMKQIDYCGQRVILTYMRDITSKVKQKL